jgi:gliding motility-associated-like protein
MIELTEVDGSFGGFTYSINPITANCAGSCNGNSAQFIDICAGNYVVTITDQSGCFKDVDFTVEQPEPVEFEFTVTNVTCYTFGDGKAIVDEITGGTEPFFISLNETEFLPWPDSAGYFNLVPGDYILEVRDSNDCAATENFTVTEPELLTITLDTTIACSCGGICDGLLQYIPQGGTPNYQYLLTPDNILGPGFGVVNGLCAGDYEIFLIDANECQDSIEFTITEPDPLTIEVLLDAPTCTGMNDGSAEITVGGGTGALSFFAEPDDYEPEVIDSVTFGLSELIEDTLYFELADENGCRIYDTLGIVPDIITDMILTMTQTPETCWNALDGTATVAVQNGNPPLNFEWDDNLLQTTATAMGLAPNAEYMVRVTDDIGCNLTASVFVEANIGCFFIATAITPNGDGVNDTWVLGGFEYYPECKVNVFNLWGQTVFSSTGYTTQWDGRFNGQLLPIGDYYFTIDYAADKEVIMGTVTVKY